MFYLVFFRSTAESAQLLDMWNWILPENVVVPQNHKSALGLKLALLCIGIAISLSNKTNSKGDPFFYISNPDEESSNLASSQVLHKISCHTKVV